MSKIIKMELTQAQFVAMVEMIEDNATSIGSAEDEFVRPTIRRLKLLQKAFKLNGIGYTFDILNGL